MGGGDEVKSGRELIKQKASTIRASGNGKKKDQEYQFITKVVNNEKS